MEKPKLQSITLGMSQNVLRSNVRDAFFKTHSGEGYSEKKTQSVNKVLVWSLDVARKRL